MFEIGQQVICIDDTPVGRPDVVPLCPIKDWVYTVRSIHIKPHLPGFGVRLEELRNPVIERDDGTVVEWSYRSERFRALSQDKEKPKKPSPDDKLHKKPEDQYQIGDKVVYLPEGVYATVTGYLWADTVSAPAQIAAYHLDCGITVSADTLERHVSP